MEFDQNLLINSRDDEQHDAIDSYFECITACSLNEEGVDCVTKCVEVHLKEEE
tara:strand:+ start:163 stop:321 length:159 start_codon:yes stop_codon:yes gene_type:complete